MATITIDTFLDSGTPRTAGETMALNGGVLTIRTDTRWHSDSPASMMGTMGTATISATLGGGLLLDGRNVRCLAYNNGIGIVPAIGTLITQGGVTGYLLSVYSDWKSAPTAVGASMPATGFLKFREVTGGSFAAGSLIGIGADATEVDKVGWIEVVFTQETAIVVPRLGSFKTRGNWFEIGVTNGSSNQVLQVPTNGGGIGTHVPAVWIETEPGSGEFDVYPCVRDTWYSTANLSTDHRSKFVQTVGDGEVRIGHDGTTDAGYVPLSGCRVVVPNVFGRQCTTGARADNATPHTSLGSRPDFTTTSAGDIDMEYFMNDWYNMFASPYRVKASNTATFDILTVNNIASPIEIDNFTTGCFQAGTMSLTMLNCPLGGTISNSRFVRPDAASNGHTLSITGCSNLRFDNVRMGIMQYARSTGAVSFSQCRNIVFDNITTYCATLIMATCANMTVKNLNYIDRLVGTTNSTTGRYAVQCIVSCDNILVDGVILSYVPNLAPYLGVFNASNCSNLTFRNVGTYNAPVDVNAAAAPAYIYTDSGNNDGVRVQRCYLEATRTSLFLTVNTSKNLTFQDLRGTTGALQTLSVNSRVLGVRSASNSVTGGASVYGSHWFDMFNDDTTGRIWLAFNEPTSTTADQLEIVNLGAGAGFTSAGQISMPNVGDEIIFTMPYYAIGHESFSGVTPVITGTNTGNFTLEYDIDVNDGNGFTGSYQTLNTTNLSAEIFTPEDGVKLKIKITTSIANATNALTYIRVNTTTSALSQETYMYPLDYTTVKLTNLAVNSRVQLYDTTNDIELYNEIVLGTELNYEIPYVSDFDCRVRVMYQDAASARTFVEFEEPVTISGLSRSITQEIDNVYVANAIDGAAVTGITINDGLFLVNVDRPTLSLQELYAFETAWLYTEEGIRDENRFITAIDQANYIFEDFKIKNVSFPTVPLIITGGYMKDKDTNEAIDVIDTTGGTIFLAPEHVVPFSTSGGGSGGDTKEDIYTYFTSSGRQNTFRADISNVALESTVLQVEIDIIAGLEIINDGVKNASLLIPHNINL